MILREDTGLSKLFDWKSIQVKECAWQQQGTGAHPEWLCRFLTTCGCSPVLNSSVPHNAAVLSFEESALVTSRMMLNNTILSQILNLHLTINSKLLTT